MQHPAAPAVRTSNKCHVKPNASVLWDQTHYDCIILSFQTFTRLLNYVPTTVICFYWMKPSNVITSQQITKRKKPIYATAWSMN